MINNTIIVARYNEDINWLNMLNNEDWISNIIVYNKGNKLENTFNDKRIKILEKKNYGREGGTYLDYIIDNYNNLPDNIWFLQGDPFEHNEYFLNFLKEENVMKYINKDYQGLTLYYKKDCNVPPYEYIKLNNNFDFNCDKNIEDHNHCKNITFLINSKHFHVVGHNFYRDLGVDEMLIYLEKNYKRKINNIADLLFNKLEFKNPKNIIPFSFSATFISPVASTTKSNFLYKFSRFSSEEYTTLNPILSASVSRSGLTSTKVIFFAPLSFAAKANNNPIGPAPKISALLDVPALIAPTPFNAQPNGSASAAI